MKKVLSLIVISIIMIASGFFVGKSYGYDEAQTNFTYRGIESIKFDLKQREIQRIITFLDGSAKIEIKDEGGLFSSKEVKYFTGSINNKALIAVAKNIKLQVIYLDKDGSEIGESEINLSEFIKPGDSQKFKRKIELSKDISDFKWDIVSAEAE